MVRGRMAHASLAGLFLWQSFRGAFATTVRENLLCEARLRLQSWYQDKSALEWPKERDGVELQISHEGLPCGGDNIPVTFGTFCVEGAEPEDVFNVLADVTAQQQWDSMVGSVTQLGEWREQQVTGHTISFVAHPFSDREVYQWEAVNATSKDDLWVVFSTEGNQALHEKKNRQGGAVAAQDCLAAYWVQRHDNGKVHVTFTSQVNSHPFLLSSSFVFNLLWGKTVDYINGLRSRAQLLAKNRHGTPPSISLPEWMYHDAAPGEEPKGSPGVVPPFPQCIAKPSNGGQDALKKFEVFPTTTALYKGGRWWLAGIVIVPGFIAGFIAAGKRILQNRFREITATPSYAGLEQGLEAQAFLQ